MIPPLTNEYVGPQNGSSYLQLGDKQVNTKLKEYKGECFICHHPCYKYYIELTPPYPNDMDCGGNCWKCQQTFEPKCYN